jgi:peptidoglycan/LPS O-acetylase OafA/YrhL
MQYRKEIDGLRAIAVIPVILFHLDIGLFNGGFLGVDIFFVISGYLITTNLLTEKENGNFSIVGFYDRRARRILPALFFVITLSIIASWFIMIPSQIKDFGQSVVAAIGFSSNIYFWLKLDYWSQSSELVPLLHIWSLGIEEQFYVIFPAFVMLLGTRLPLRIATILLVVSSYFFMCAMHEAGKVSESFYLLPFRAWELAIGSLAAMYASEIILATKKYNLNWLSSLGGILILVSLFFLNETTNIYLLHAAPVLGAVLLILFANSLTFEGKILSKALFVKIGLISYSLYLTHQPVLAFSRLLINGPLTVNSIIVCLLLIIITALISYFLIELPFRDKRKIKTKQFYALLILVGSLLAAFGFAANKTEGFMEYKISQLSPKESSLISSLAQQKKIREEHWNEHTQNSRLSFDMDGRKRILFVGDSISEDLFVAAIISTELDEVAEVRRLPLDEACIESMGISGEGKYYSTCGEEWSAFINSTILLESQYIVLANSWLPANAGSVDNFIELIKPMGKKIILFNQHQFADMTSIVMGAKKFSFDVNSSNALDFFYNSRHQRTIMANEVLRKAAQPYNLKVIDGFSYFCDESQMKCRLFDINGTPRLIDVVHFSSTGVLEFSSWFSSEILTSIEN